MTTIAEHNATVLPFKDALLRAPSQRRRFDSDPLRDGTDGPLPDNVIVLARFARSRAAHGRHWLGGPPEGEAA
jgi:hypothetical protein